MYKAIVIIAGITLFSTGFDLGLEIEIVFIPMHYCYLLVSSIIGYKNIEKLPYFSLPEKIKK